MIFVVPRDQMTAHYEASRVQVACANEERVADPAFDLKAAFAAQPGFKVDLGGPTANGRLL